MATGNTEVSRLLVLGPDQESNLVLISKLRELSGDLISSVNKDVRVLNLNTKYYRASVEVHVHHVLDNVPEPALQYELHDYEAVLCVMDAGQRENFLHVHRFAKKIVDTVPYDVCLLVAGTSSATMESVKKMEGWCQDNGYEFVDLDAEQHNHSEENVIDEKQGIERVLEALHCNMWRSMEMHPPKQEVAMVKEKDGNAEVAVESNKKSEEIKETGIEKNTNAEEQDESTDDSRLQTLLQALEIAGDTSTGETGAGGEDDIDMVQFSALISEVRNVRDQGQSLSDEQRRERAAEVAMKLWNFLGADDEDSDASDTN